MKIDIIVGNPPYQEETGAGTVVTGKKPIYQDFVLQGINISSRFICMIIPSRWAMCGSGLEDMYYIFYNNRQHIRSITDYMSWDNTIFGSSVQIAGGVMYFIIDKEYIGSCNYFNVEKTNTNKLMRELTFTPTFIRNNNLVSICHKVQELKEYTMINLCRTNTFGLESFCRGDETGDIDLLTSSGWCKIHRNKIRCNIDSIDKYKLAVSGTTPGGGSAGAKGEYKVLASLIPLKPAQVCTNTYITIGDFDTEEELSKLIKYLQTKFIRSLILATISSMHIIPYSFTYVPVIDSDVPCSDEQLYDRYKLSIDEIEYIERSIKAWK